LAKPVQNAAAGVATAATTTSPNPTARYAIAVRPDDRYAAIANATSVALAPATTVVVIRYNPSMSSILSLYERR